MAGSPAIKVETFVSCLCGLNVTLSIARSQVVAHKVYFNIENADLTLIEGIHCEQESNQY